jgi:hypothetical protein
VLHLAGWCLDPRREEWQRGGGASVTGSGWVGWRNERKEEGGPRV